MEDAGAIPMAIRRAEKAATPPAQPPGRRRRSSIAATGAAWPAFPREANAGAGVGGLGSAKRSPAASGGNGDGAASKSPSSSGFSPVSFGGGGSVSGGVGAGRSGSSCGGCRVSGCGGVKSPGIVRKTSACCNSCRPSAAAGAAHNNNQQQQHGKGENGGRIEYDDVFGGPPKYLASTCNGRKMSIPDYDDIFRTTNPRSFASIAQQPVRTKSRTAELPVFDPPEYDTEVFGGPPAEKPRSPATIAYEDVFGGPLTGPRTRLLKDLLRCSGASDSKWKSGSKSKGSSQSDCSFQSPISSMHSASHGNPIYEFESEVFGDANDFKGSSFESVGKSPQAYVEPESIGKPVMTSVSASSSPFTEYFDDSTVHSYSSRASKNAHDRVVQLDYEKIYRNVSQPANDVNKDFVVEPDMEVASTSSTESFELEFTKRASSKKAFGNNHRKRREKKSFSALKRPSTVESENASPLQRSSSVVSPEVESLHMPSTATYFQSGTFGNERQEDVCAATRGTEQDRETDDFDLEQSNQPSIKCFSAQADENLQHFTFTDVASKREAKQVSFITVNHVKLTTEPTNVPPARPAPSRNLEVMSEKEMSELLETEAFMEYSIKDLDGLVAEEYLVSQESVSDSSPSSLSVSKTSASGRSYEDEDSEHSYAEDSILGVEGKVTEGESVRKLERRPVKRPLPKQLHKREKELETERNSYGRDKKDKVQQAKFLSEEKQTNGPAIETKQDTITGQNVLGESVVLERESTETVKEQVADSFPEDSTDELGRSKSSSEEMISSSSSSFEEQMFPKEAPLSDDWSSLCVPEFEEIEGETPERRRSRQERHQRALERVAKVLAEKNNRELEHERAEAEKQRVAEVLDDVIKRWAAGKQGNLRALLSTLQYILWPECGWQPVSLMDIIEPAFVRKAYRKATLCVHPDKLQQKGASIEHKYIAEKVFDHLQEAWTIFNYEQLL